MRIIKQLKKNNGSTLTMVLFMLFMLSVTAIAVITLTGSELSMSVMTSDRSKALLAAKAGAEKAAQVLDTAVAQAQENAQVKSEQIIQSEVEKYKAIREDPDTHEKVPVNKIEAPFTGIIDNYSTPGVVKILKQDELDKIHDMEYKYQFFKNIRSWYNSQIQSGKEWNDADGQPVTIKSKDVGIFIYSSPQIIDAPDTVAKVTTLSPEPGEENPQTPVYSVRIISTGKCAPASNGSTYKRSVKAEFGLLTYSNNGTYDIPVTYGKLTKIRINKSELPSILDNKALIAGKNIISLDENVDVKGNTVCFGTIPTKNNEINYDAPGYEFGGIMAGIVPDKIGDTAEYTDLKTNMKVMGFLEDYFSQSHKGSFKFEGNVSTAAYVHTLYGRSDLEHSDIEVTGNTFARNFNVESESNYSEIKLKNIYTYNDLVVDGNKSDVWIGGWKNEDSWEGGNEGCLVGLKPGSYTDPLSSSVIVSGDSRLFINGSVYVGGSTSYTDYTNIDNKTYVSGMSIQKSDSRPAEAFEIGANEFNHDNIFYMYNNDTKTYENYKQNEEHKYRTAPYKKKMYNESNEPYYEDGKMMMEGEFGSTNPFTIVQRAMHLKRIWEDYWIKDIGYASYFNTGDIVIKPDNNNKIKGFCWGGVAANNTIYGPYNGFTESDGAYNTKINGDFSGNYKGLLYEYAKSMNLFVNENDSKPLDLTSPSKKLSGNSKTSDDSVYKSALSTVATPDFFKSYASSGTFMYYGNKNIMLSNDNIYDGTNHSISGKGIVYTEGDIYVAAGTNFRGILIAEGNIVFTGNTNTNSNIEYDKEVVTSLLQDQQIGRFFKHTLSDVIMNDPNAIIQTVKKKNVKNIKIISWKEV